jgi:hypothetical protein
MKHMSEKSRVGDSSWQELTSIPGWRNRCCILSLTLYLDAIFRVERKSKAVAEDYLKKRKNITVYESEK